MTFHHLARSRCYLGLLRLLPIDIIIEQYIFMRVYFDLVPLVNASVWNLPLKLRGAPDSPLSDPPSGGVFEGVGNSEMHSFH